MKRPHGRKVRGPGGVQAFVPAPLPPPLEWSAGLAAQLSEADRAIGRLAGEGRRIPNPHQFIRPFVRREAVLSSRIEGTQATLGELLAAEAGAAVDRSPADLREVGNYVTALEHGALRLKQLPLSLRLVRELHERLMHGVRGDTATPGEFRRSQNWIGAPGSTPATAAYVPPPPDQLMDCLGAWERYLHDTTLPPLVHAALIHSQFEAIHPFQDGNGRVGRLMITLMLLDRKLLPAPLLYLSAYFDMTRDQYYARLQGVTEHGEWEAWVSYFLAGVLSQSMDALSRIERIDALAMDWRKRIEATASRTTEGVLAELMKNPFVRVKALAERLDVAFTTAQRAVDRLADAGVLTLATDAKRDRVYCARELLAILEKEAGPGRAATPRDKRVRS
jgi:Fic family protein